MVWEHGMGICRVACDAGLDAPGPVDGHQVARLDPPAAFVTVGDHPHAER